MFHTRLIHTAATLTLLHLVLVSSSAPPTQPNTQDLNKQLNEDKENEKSLEDAVKRVEDVTVECAKTTGAEQVDVLNFLQKRPQDNRRGKCFVDCYYKEHGFIDHREVTTSAIRIFRNVEIFGKGEADTVVKGCRDMADKYSDDCDFTSAFNDCLNGEIKRLRVAVPE